jgi:hypothetical protein
MYVCQVVMLRYKENLNMFWVIIQVYKVPNDQRHERIDRTKTAVALACNNFMNARINH